MTEAPRGRADAAAAGALLIAAILGCAAAGYGLGSLAGLAVPVGLAGLFVGLESRIAHRPWLGDSWPLAPLAFQARSSWGWPLSTLALSSSRRLGDGGAVGMAFRYGDLVLLAAALPVFLIAGWPMLGYVVAAAAWLAQRGIQLVATRRVRSSMAGGDRRAALGIMGATTLARVWLIALAVLIVGLVEREAGLAAALLSAALFTLYFGSQVLDRLLHPEDRP